LGHFARVCTRKGGRNSREETTRRGNETYPRRYERQGNARTVRYDTDETEEATLSESEEIGGIGSVKVREVVSKENSRPTPMMRDVMIIPDGQGMACKKDCLPDTGCTQSLISEDIVRETGMKIDTNTKKKIRAVNDQKLECSGTATFTAKYEGRTAIVSALVSSSIQDEILLSWKELVNLGVIPTSFPHVKAEAKSVTYSPPVEGAASKTKSMIDSFDDVFDDFNTPESTTRRGTKRKGDDAVVKPVNVFTPKKTAGGPQEAAEQRIDKSKEVIEKTTKPTDWCSALPFAKIQNNGMRSVLDSSQFGKYVKGTTHPSPSPSNIVASINKSSNCFAVFNTTEEHLQVPPANPESLADPTKERGRHRHAGESMGMVPSGGGFGHKTGEALADLDGVHESAADILVCANNFEQLHERIRAVFERCGKNGITLSKDTYQLGPEVKFAGYVINGKGTRQDPGFLNATTPTKLTDLKGLKKLVNKYTDPVGLIQTYTGFRRAIPKHRNAPRHEELHPTQRRRRLRHKTEATTPTYDHLRQTRWKIVRGHHRRKTNTEPGNLTTDTNTDQHDDAGRTQSSDQAEIRRRHPAQDPMRRRLFSAI
jgi:hypothetical protein